MDDLKRGDMLILRYDNQVMRCRVELASDNGRSLLVEFADDALRLADGYSLAFGAPILRDETGIYRCLLDGHPVILERVQ